MKLAQVAPFRQAQDPRQHRPRCAPTLSTPKSLNVLAARGLSCEANRAKQEHACATTTQSSELKNNPQISDFKSQIEMSFFIS